MSEWQDISTAPRDGSPVWVKRVYEGAVIAEGEAVFDYLHPSAPSLHPPAGLGVPSRWAEELAAEKHWLRPNRMHFFPAPTHWRPVA